MKPVFYSSKEEIRNRIVKNAEDFWNIRDSNDLDPLVRLIIEALSNELFNVSNDVQNLENRIFDKLSRILAPDHLTSALPAHAVMHARAIERTDYINPFTQFSIAKRMGQDDDRNKKTDIFFSPLHKVKLQNAEVKYIATGASLYGTSYLNKVPLLSTLPGFNLGNNTMYIGLSGLGSYRDLSGLNFFFDWRNYAVPEHTYDLLSLSKWYLDEVPVPVFTERFMDADDDTESVAPFHHKQLLNLLKADVIQYYANRFLTLERFSALDISAAQSSYPQLFSTVFQPGNLNQLDANVLWLKVVFPAAISNEMLNELFVHINAFPVVNKKLSQIKHRLKTMNNIIPIKTEALEQMLAVDSLKDNKGKNYNEIPYTNENDKGDGSFSIRYGGTERFDTRNAKELVDYLFELLRDEKAAFSAYGPDFLNNALKNLEQNISLIEQKSQAALKSIKELPGYIVVKPIDDADILFLDIWVTQAEDANRINSGSRLALHENNKVLPDSVFLLSQSRGGRSRLNASHRVQAYKYGLTTADRIVTKADVINFCKYELGKRVQNVILSKGLVRDTKPGSGFIKTTDVLIQPAAQARLSNVEWEELLELTLAKLQLRSTMNVNYRMMLHPVA
ncbi:type VI secretion system baseplate subunit TssF [Pedobacter duraquae]|uniref:Uncharacterized protein n=1 Tax=Pedobacter duraquae TaxID=425511 RepID=A0A4R6IRL5_9SPHI|nr:type VI secretion system baseplate subunit TssF [Pedobacter duraquae]TDO24917.1 hypothetical protein CLV32_1212 [Pedobacter duraquae]